MRKKTITFELATEFLPKIALRLECLFQTIQQAAKETHPIIHEYALKNIIEIIRLIEKPELKSRFLKEFMRIEHSLNKSDTTISNVLYANLFVQIQHLNHVAGNLGEIIQKDPFLQSLRLAQTMHQGDTELPSPQLLIWLGNTTKHRQDDINKWLKLLQLMIDTVTIYLSLLRDTADFFPIQLINGFYQCPISSKTACHLILLRMENHCGLVPKMLLGHHSFSLRLYEVDSMTEVYQTDTAIDLAICQL